MSTETERDALRAERDEAIAYRDEARARADSAEKRLLELRAEVERLKAAMADVATSAHGAGQEDAEAKFRARVEALEGAARDLIEASDKLNGVAYGGALEKLRALLSAPAEAKGGEETP